MDRKELAQEYFKKGYNCAQAILSTYADLFGLSEQDAYRIAEGFGTGMGAMGETCGAVTAAFMLIGLKNSNGKLILDFHIIIAYGVSIMAVTENLISNVKYKLESYTGMEVEKINIFVEGVRVID